MKLITRIVILLLISAMFRGCVWTIRKWELQAPQRAIEATRSALLQNATRNGKKDFMGIQPYRGYSVSIQLEGHPSAYPPCTEMYENVPDKKASSAKELCEWLRHDQCVLNSDQKLDNTYYLTVYEHSDGMEAYITSLLFNKFLVYVNGGCSLTLASD